MGILRTVTDGDSLPEGKVWVVYSEAIKNLDTDGNETPLFRTVDIHRIFIGPDFNEYFFDGPSYRFQLYFNVLEIEGEFISQEKLSTNDYVVPEGKVFYARSIDPTYYMLGLEGQRVKPRSSRSAGILLDLSKTKV